MAITNLIPSAISAGMSGSQGLEQVGIGSTQKTMVKPEDETLGVEFFEFDALLGEQFSRDIKITEFPVEDGSPVADHQSVSTGKLTLTGEITGTADILNVFNPELYKTLYGIRSYTDFKNTSFTGSGKLQKTIQQLDSMSTAGSLFSITTGVYVWNNMAISHIGTNRNTAFDKIEVNINFVQVTYVKTQEVDIEPQKTKNTPKISHKAGSKNAQKKSTDSPVKSDWSKVNTKRQTTIENNLSLSREGKMSGDKIRAAGKGIKAVSVITG